MELKKEEDKQQPTNPLTSIIVITYNSSKYVLETLESIKNQTYKNIELIISDDCSSDNTINICREWIDINKERFVRTEVITVEINTGISANCNRGVRMSKGIWIKAIAGDDILCSNAISEYISFVNENNHEICCSKMELFGEDQATVENNIKIYAQFFSLMELPLKKQKKLIRKQLYIPGPGIIFSRYLYDLVDGFDERFPMGEEWPFYLKIFEEGFTIPLLSKDLVRYRITDISACRGNRFGANLRVINSGMDFFFKVRLWNMLQNFMFFSAWHEAIYYIYMSKLIKDKTRLELCIFKSIYLLDPIFLYTKIKKIFNP